MNHVEKYNQGRLEDSPPRKDFKVLSEILTSTPHSLFLGGWQETCKLGPVVSKGLLPTKPKSGRQSYAGGGGGVPPQALPRPAHWPIELCSKDCITRMGSPLKTQLCPSFPPSVNLPSFSKLIGFTVACVQHGRQNVPETTPRALTASAGALPRGRQDAGEGSWRCSVRGLQSNWWRTTWAEGSKAPGSG